MFQYIAGTQNSYLLVLVYNFCAFAMQMPLGLVVDKLNRNPLVAVCGAIMVGAAYGLAPFFVVGAAYGPVAFQTAAVIIIGIGNALFHLGGGVDVLNISEKKLSALGVFVSPGALGIFLGTMLGRGSGFSAAFFPVALVVAAFAILAVHRAQRGAYPQNAAFSLEGASSRSALVAIACLLLVVCLRSFVGMSLSFPWKGIGYWGIALLCAVVLGKTLGGFAADRLGLKKTAVISLGAAAILFLLPSVPVAGVTAVLLFNMTMPITLWALARVIPGAKGFAFGLLTFALFMGFLPVYLGFEVLSDFFWLFALLAAVSLLLLWTGLKKAKL